MQAFDVDYDLQLAPTEGRSPGIHLSDLLKLYGDAIGYFKPTRDDDKYKTEHFEKGFLWEEMLSEMWARRHRRRREDDPERFLIQPEYKIDGVYLTLDVVDMERGVVEESKSTTRSMAKFTNDQLEQHFPLWLAQIKAQCRAAAVNDVELFVFFLCGDYRPPFPAVKVKHMVFTDRELAENWAMLLRFKSRLERSR